MFGRWVLASVLATLIGACAGGGSENSAPAGNTSATIVPNLLPNGIPGARYATTLFVNPDQGLAYSWTVIQGRLPPGLSGIPGSGRSVSIAGTTTTAGTYTFTVQVTAPGVSATRSYSLSVGTGGPPPPPPPPPPGGGPGWTAMSTAGAPAARGEHTAVWTGTEMIVWGGLNFVSIYNTGGAYNPTTNNWRTISQANAPAGRFGHTAVWSGTEMIVFGGGNSAGLLNSGGAYNPATDQWRTITPTGAPQARSIHTAVWTGSRMIVYGGQGVIPPPAPNSVDLVFADGGAYNPANDTWSAVTGILATRWHPAVWTGTRMVVWGGRDGFALSFSTINAGGVYDPGLDAWRATAMSNAPVARAAHTAVWTGTDMVIWGGLSGLTAALASGGVYDPTGDTWRNVTTAGAPSARHTHTAVWSGNEMIVWGGQLAGGNLTGTGGAYDPLADSWRTLSSTGAPTARADHTAVWTSTSMIIWGGRTRPADTYLNSGGVWK